MFSKFEEQGIFNEELGRLYRKTILAPGGTKDGMTMVKDFLGREPSIDAFIRQNGFE